MDVIEVAFGQEYEEQDFLERPTGRRFVIVDPQEPLSDHTGRLQPLDGHFKASRVIEEQGMPMRLSTPLVQSVESIGKRRDSWDFYAIVLAIHEHSSLYSLKQVRRVLRDYQQHPPRRYLRQ